MVKIKFNSIETLILQPLIDIGISHDEFIAIFEEKDKCKKMKENLRSENEKQDIVRFSSLIQRLKRKTIEKYSAFYAIKKILFFSWVCINVSTG